MDGSDGAPASNLWKVDPPGGPGDARAEIQRGLLGNVGRGTMGIKLVKPRCAYNVDDVHKLPLPDSKNLMVFI
jgi:hypothetical protein